MFRCLRLRKLKAERAERRERRAAFARGARLNAAYRRAWAAYDRMHSGEDKRLILSALTIYNQHTAEYYEELADAAEKFIAIEQRRLARQQARTS